MGESSESQSINQTINQSTNQTVNDHERRVGIRNIFVFFRPELRPNLILLFQELLL